MNVKIQNVALKPGEAMITIGNLLAKKEAGEATEFEDIFTIGEGKGVPFEFKESEEITFDKIEELLLVVRVSRLNGKDYKMLSILGMSNLRGQVEVPVSIFRRVPALAKDRDLLVENFPLTEKFLQNNLSDFARVLSLAGMKILICKVLNLAKVLFRTVNGKIERVDVEALPEEERKLMRFYQIQSL